MKFQKPCLKHILNGRTGGRTNGQAQNNHAPQLFEVRGIITKLTGKQFNCGGIFFEALHILTCTRKCSVYHRLVYPNQNVPLFGF